MKKKIEKPKISRCLEEVYDIINEIYDEEYLEDKIIENITISDIYEVRVRFNSCIFKNVVFENCDLRKADITDVIFENCNMSNINFSDSGIYRAEFINCKLTGTIFEDSIFKYVVFKDSIGRYSNFSFSKFKGVRFKNSDFQSGVFQEVHNHNLEVENTDLSKSIFNGISLKGVDFTTCNIDGCEFRLKDLSGGIFSVVQSLELAKLMGIIIK